mmetsp:Transcript_10664/g.21110  ORF Transcript_10664/g.21110 Transcript_10664/m.21110 type:complete len:100 (+) Transcript_10664:705-1004(+)
MNHLRCCLPRRRELLVEFIRPPRRLAVVVAFPRPPPIPPPLPLPCRRDDDDDDGPMVRKRLANSLSHLTQREHCAICRYEGGRRPESKVKDSLRTSSPQ